MRSRQTCLNISLHSLGALIVSFFRKDMCARSKYYTTLLGKQAENTPECGRFRLLAQIHQETLMAVGDEAQPKRREPQPKTSLRYPDLPSNLPLRLHFLAQGSLRRERAAALCEYVASTERQTAATGETLLSVAVSNEDIWLFERLVETLGEGGLNLPVFNKSGFEFRDNLAAPADLTDVAMRMATENNHARTFSWQFERVTKSEQSPSVPSGKPRIPDDLPWDPDPVYQSILEKTHRNDLYDALSIVCEIDPERREILFDEVLYLKFCVYAPITAQDLRYVVRKYIRRSSVSARLEEEFDAFLDVLDPLLQTRNIESFGYPWDQLRPWSEFKTGAYRDLKTYGHPSWPRGRLFVWHPDFYARSADHIDRTFTPDFIEAENIFRRLRGIPEIGRGWASEAALFDLVRSRFPDAIFQWSPHWLGRQSVDIYVPSNNVAFEYQGEQHYRPVELFGGEEGFQATQARDAQKRQRLARKGVLLIEWRFDTPITGGELDRAISAHLAQKPGIT